MTKICSSCGVEKNLDEFYKDNRFTYSKVISKCKKCKNLSNKKVRTRDGGIKQRKRIKNWYQKNRKFIVEFKTKNNRCNDCKQVFPYWILEFDHLHNKIYEMHNIHIKTGLKNIKKEIDKCEIVCANCHRARTWSRNPLTSPKSVPTGKNKYIRDIKESSFCADCNKKYPYYVLQFDHIKDKNIALSTGKIYGFSLEQIKEEIANCNVVCANCHANRTFTRIKDR